MSSSSLREASEDDADAIAALFAASFGDARRVDAEEVRSWLRNEEIKPENVRVLEVAGRVVGYGDVWVEDWTQRHRVTGSRSSNGRSRAAAWPRSSARRGTSSPRSPSRAAIATCAPR